MTHTDFTKKRQLMVEEQLKKRDITDEKILNAMAKIPREKFVSQDRQNYVYQDAPVPIGHNQTISQPYVVAKMCQLLRLKSTDKILDVGAGSGYQTALLAKIVQKVIGLEIIPELAEQAKETLKKLGYNNVEIITQDGKLGYQSAAPYDGIVSAAASDEVPQAWKDQLKTGGRIVAPLGHGYSQRITVLTKTEDGWKKDEQSGVVFVPLV